LRLEFLGHFAPLALDAVIAAPDRDDVGALVFPNEAAARKLAPQLPPSAPLAQVLADPAVKAAFRDRLEALAGEATGSASRVVRLALIAKPPSIDLGEITDKGSLNQRALLTNRAADVEALYASELRPHVVRL